MPGDTALHRRRSTRHIMERGRSPVGTSSGRSCVWARAWQARLPSAVPQHAFHTNSASQCPCNRPPHSHEPTPACFPAQRSPQGQHTSIMSIPSLPSSPACPCPGSRQQLTSGGSTHLHLQCLLIHAFSLLGQDDVRVHAALHGGLPPSGQQSAQDQAHKLPAASGSPKPLPWASPPSSPGAPSKPPPTLLFWPGSTAASQVRGIMAPPTPGRQAMRLVALRSEDKQALF